MKRARLAFDIAIIGLLAGAILLDLTGGFYSEPFGLRVSARRGDRPFFLAILLILIRWRVWRSDDFLGRPKALYARWIARVFHPAADDARPGAGTGAWHAAAATLGLMVIGAVLMQAQLRQMHSVPDLGDPLFSIWRMGWVSHQLAGDPRGLFDANILHPSPLTLTLSDSILLPSLMAAPFFAAGVHPVLAYNIVFLSGFLLSGIATYVLVVRLTGSPAAAFLGAVFYAFHPYRMEHYSHLELQMTQWMPLALLALVRLGETRRARYAVAAAVCAAAQLYSSMYYGVYFPFFAAAVIGALLLMRRWDWRPLVRPAAIGAGLALALAMPLARPYLDAQAIKGDRDTASVQFYSAASRDYLRANNRSAVYAGRLGDPLPERALFPGAMALALSAAALAPPVGPVRVAFSAGLLVAFDLSRGLKGMLYPTLYEWFPPIRGMRVPARFSIILGISLAVLASFGARRLLDRCRGRLARRTLFLGLVVLTMGDLYPTLPLLPVWREPPRIYQEIAGREDVVLAEFPIRQGDPTITDEVPYMYFSFWHWRQMVNGYSGFELADHEILLQDVRGFPDDVSLAALRSRGVTHVTVNCAFIGDFCGDLLAKVDARPEFRLMRIAHWQMRPTRLYELTK